MTALAASAAGAPGTFFHEGFAKLAAPFLAGGVLETADVQVVDLVCGGRVTPEADVMLAFALAVRAPRHGHVGVDLATVRERAFEETRLGTDDAEAELRSLPWPEDPEAWLGRVRASPLVGTAGSPERRPFVLHDGLLMTLRWWTQQERLAAALQARLGCPELPVGTERPGGRRPVDAVELRRGLAALFPDPPAAMQRLAALVAVLRPLTVISGGPGTGKTSTVQRMLALLFAQWHGACGAAPLVALAAPTGKAAVRMQEAVRKSPEVLAPVHEGAPAWVTALEASTIHRLLGPAPQGGFRHGSARHLPHDVVVVDEASMIDVALMRHLVEAVRPDARLVLLGDRDQLASVAAGTVLADLTRGAGPSNMRFSPATLKRLREIDPALGLAPLEAQDAPPLADAVVHLTECFRQEKHSAPYEVMRVIQSLGAELGAPGGRSESSPPAVTRAVALLTGRAVESAPSCAPIEFFPHDGDRLAEAAIAAMVAGWIDIVRFARERPPGGRSETQRHAALLRMLARFRVLAAHRRGPFGVAGLNAEIGARLRAALGDPRAGQGGHVAVDTPLPDGWIGRPVIVTENRYDVGLMNGDVGIVVRGERPGHPRIAFPGAAQGTVVYHELAAMPPHQTVFAMTIHKSQGSEFEHTFVVLPAFRSRILTRELLYTAVTRTSKRLSVAGDPAVLGHALARTVDRASCLGAMLWP